MNPQAFIIGFVVGIIMFVAYKLWLSPEARSTRELARLNSIWEEYNERIARNETYTDVSKALYMVQWKYHKDKADMLKDFMSKMKEAGYDERISVDLNNYYGKD